MLDVQCANRPQPHRSLGFDATLEKPKRPLSKGRRRNLRQQFPGLEFGTQKPDDSVAREREPKVGFTIDNVNQEQSAQSKFESRRRDLLARWCETPIGEFLPNLESFNQVLVDEIRRGPNGKADYAWARRAASAQVEEEQRAAR